MTGGRVHFFCVDGTNVVRVVCGYGGEHFRAQESADIERLVAVLSGVREASGGRAEIEIFFDGPVAPSAPALRVKAAHEQAADELIMDSVRSRLFSVGGGVSVVTGDGELGRWAAAEGARWINVRPGLTMEGLADIMESRFRK